jgi:5-hydroxyisourate hydrolase
MGKLTTHVLDTANGKPASGVKIRLFSLENGRHLVASVETNDNGRTDEPLMDGDTFRAGVYELEISIGDYFSGTQRGKNERPFLDDIVIRVTLADDDHYHVPLLVTPWSYSTYRGS